MANEAEVFGLPEVLINFKTKGTTAIKRSARGIVAMILKDGTTDSVAYYKISDSTDIPTTLSDTSIDLIKKCLKGTPLRILLYVIPASAAEGKTNTTTQATVLKMIATVKWNYICAPTATGTDMSDLADWIKAERTNKRKTFKAVVAKEAADNEGVLNFCTEDIKVATGTDTSGNLVYTTYTPAQYTARIAGIFAGLALDRSGTYFSLPEVESCHVYDDLEERIDKGELHIFDELDGNGVKIARACNSLTTFTTDKGEDFRYIKIMEAVDMITVSVKSSDVSPPKQKGQPSLADH